MRRMLIDAAHPEETRVVAINGTRLEELDLETSTKRQLKGNIYLAKIIRVEPSLQAAFVDYGGGRHGFLAFSEIHPDYFQIPAADREALLAEQRAESLRASSDQENESGEDEGNSSEARPHHSSRSLRHFKIQDVIKRRQIILVQVVKEERGNKGAALTTYLSLAGRYCVLMPNTARGGGGVSRKITSISDRRRLKSITADLEISEGMAVIVRTAGSERTRAEIKRDYEYLLRLWDNIRTLTLSSVTPTLVYEEANLIKRAIRDLYTKDTEEILVEGEEGYRAAKDFMRMLTPSHAKKVQPYKDPLVPLFHRYQVESQLDGIYSAIVQLRSGGYIVINPTEALVSIDVNSGRATKERHIEETALKTNLEAADEVARQLRLRDLAGLVVVDFIDMEDPRNNAAVERRFKEATKTDRARIQLGHISMFGLLELSRQRLRPSLQEASTHTCPHCNGSGFIRSVESSAIYILRIIEEEGIRRLSSEITLTVATPIALYILNQKRQTLNEMESRYGFHVVLMGDDTLIPPEFRIERVKASDMADLAPPRSVAIHQEYIEEEEEEEKETPPAAVVVESVAVEVAAVPEVAAHESVSEDEDEREDNGKNRRRRRKKRSRHDHDDAHGSSSAPASNGNGDEHDEHQSASESDADDEADDANGSSANDEGHHGSEAHDDQDSRKSRRRGKRGGRRRNRRNDDETPQNGDSVPLLAAPAHQELLSAPPVLVSLPAFEHKEHSEVPAPVIEAEQVAEQPVEKSNGRPKAKNADTEEKPRRSRKKPAAAPAKEAKEERAPKAVEAVSTDAAPVAEPARQPVVQPAAPQEETPVITSAAPQRRGWWNRPTEG